MKKIIVVLMILVFTGFVFARVPVNHTAKLAPAKSMSISGGTFVSFRTLSAEFTYGLKKANIHAKAYLAGGSLTLEGIMQHYLTEFKTIDLGFSYGGSIVFGVGYMEFSPIAMWNMSYQLASNVAFYGGIKYKIDIGNNTLGLYFDNDLNGYLGTQINIIDNLELYIEVQPDIWSSTNNAYIGVNYYFGKKTPKVEIPGA